MSIARALAGMIVPAFFLAGVVAAPAMAQEKKMEKKAEKKMEAGKPAMKEIVKNDKLRAYEVVFKPGDEGANVERPARVVKAIKGGTLTRIYPDGKKEHSVYKD